MLQGGREDKKFVVDGLVGGKSYAFTVVLKVCFNNSLFKSTASLFL